MSGPSDDQRLASIQDVIQANILTIIIVCILAGLLHTNYLMFHDYAEVAAWAFIFAQALQSTKQRVLETIWEIRGTEYVSFYSYLRDSRPKNFATVLKSFVDWAFLVLAVLLFCSMCIQMFGFMLFLSLALGTITVSSVVILILDKRLLRVWSLVGLSDNYAISMIVLFGLFAIASYVLLFLGVQTLIEGVDAGKSTYGYLHNYLTNTGNDKLLALWKSSEEYIQLAYTKLEENYNTTEVWPMAVTIKHGLENQTARADVPAQLIQQAEKLYSDASWWPTVKTISDALLAEDEAARTSLQDDAIAFVWSLDFQKVYEFASYGSQYVAGLLSNPLQMISSFVRYFGEALVFISGLGTHAIFFIIFSLKMLSYETDMLSLGIKILVPTSGKTQDRLTNELRSIFQDVFFIPLQFASMHAVITLIVFSALQVKFLYFATFLVFMFTLVPLIQPLIIILPWALVFIIPAIIHQDIDSVLGFIRGVVLLVAHYFLYQWVEAAATSGNNKRELQATSPVITAMGVALGYTVFGWRGVILGPIAVCVLSALISLRLEQHEKPKNKEPESSYIPYDDLRDHSFKALKSGKPKKL